MPYSSLHRHRSKPAAIFFRLILCFLLCTTTFPKHSIAQTKTDYDEVSVFLNIKYLGGTEIPSIIKDEVLYLSVTDLFEYLGIRNQLTSGADSLSGFFINPQDAYLIDITKHRILYQKNTFDLKPDDFILSRDQLFLKSNYFDEVFGLECVFNIRTLSVNMTSKTELPAVKAFLLEKNRLKFHTYDQPFIADTTIEKKFRLFHLGAADWSIISKLQSSALDFTRFRLALGGVLAGGELKAVITHATNRPFLERQQYYSWRYANNKSQVVRQIVAGKISTQSISSIFDPVVGIQVSNTPTYSRKSYGSYTYSDYVLPDCLVELYVNNKLIDYIQSDASGLITYDIPLSYGSNNIRLRYSSPWGDEQTHFQNIVIPHTFLPVNIFEYKISAGIVEDGIGSFFSQGRMNYGLTDNITIGGGLEYLTSIQTAQSLPFLTASVKLTNNMYFTGEYVDGVRYKGNLAYRSPSRMQLELKYIKYNEPQEAIRFNYDEEWKAVISTPLRIGKRSGFSRLAFNQYRIASGMHNNVEFQLSLSSRGVSMNIANYAYFRPKSEPNIYNNVTLSFKLPARISFNPTAIYNYTDKKFISVNLRIEKYFSRNFSVNVAYEQRFDHMVQYYRVGFRYDFSFARISSTVSYSEDKSVFYQSAGGSLIYEKKSDYIHLANNSNVGRGGVAFLAFLDLNGDGKKDDDEPNVKGLNIGIHRGGGQQIHSDSTVIYSGLEPYQYYGFKVDGNNFENISWRVIKSSLSIVIDPNQIKLIEIPVVPVGEVSGMVYLKDENGNKGIGRIKVNVYNHASRLVASTITESDGYFSYLGLIPGSYSARMDDVQLTKLQMTVNPPVIPFTIAENRDGDIKDDLEFILDGIPGK